MWFSKKKFQKEIKELELRIKRLENPPKFKIGDKTKFGTVVEVRPIKLVEYNKDIWCFTDGNYYSLYNEKSKTTLGGLHENDL